jgi:hypothetical protein
VVLGFGRTLEARRSDLAFDHVASVAVLSAIIVVVDPRVRVAAGLPMGVRHVDDLMRRLRRASDEMFDIEGPVRRESAV